MRRSFAIAAAVIFPAISLFFCSTQIALGQEIILHNFQSTDGQEPASELTFDSEGNLYGSTFMGGTLGYGVVYKMIPGSEGWSESVLFDFNGINGNLPSGNVVLDSAGNFYGTAYMGGAFGIGAAFELSPSGGGEWNFAGLHDFSNHGGDGTYPHAGMVFDSQGNLYGTTLGGGTSGDGTIFELTRNSEGGWTETILHSFNGTYGSQPSGGVVIDASGNLYGTTYFGGGSTACNGGCGVVYELAVKSGGGWTYKVLHDFNNNDGGNPSGSVTVDARGNVYGSTSQGGAYNAGVIYRLGASSGWKQTILHNFNSSGVDGNDPFGYLAQDSAGNLYGVTQNGGPYAAGIVFELSPRSSGPWKERILHAFNPNTGDGSFPNGGVVLDGSGNLYGTTENSGAYGYGVVFEIKR